jgi:DNA invertase Pin-like site-specific DNA recombinase
VEVWSEQEDRLQAIGPFGEIVVHILAWMAQQDMRRHSERTRNGMAARGPRA